MIHSTIKDELCFSVNEYLFKLEQSSLGLSKLSLIKKNQWINNPHPSTLLKEAQSQLEAYFQGRLQSFDLNLDQSSGTSFQRKVWHALNEIPYGEVITYGELAKKIENPKAYRAVGTANGANPLPIIVPCHRVLATQGLGGYAYGLEMKKNLLRIESLC